MPPATAPRLLAHRWFFALKPDDITARRTHVFAAEQLGEQGLLAPDRHHMTLALTADFDREPHGLVDALMHAGSTVIAAPFALHLDQLSGSSRTVALRPAHVVRPLRDLQKGLAAAMAGQGIAMRPDWSFSPHETLCYRKGEPFHQPVEGFHWAVTSFVLVHSFVGLSQHETIGCWPIHAPDDPQGRLF